MARKPPPKRARNGTGNIREVRPGYYQGSIQFAPKDRRTVSGRSEEEVEEKLLELRALRRENRLPPKSSQTTGEYLWQWHRDHVVGHNAPSTAENYALNIDRVKVLHGIPLKDLGPDDILAAYRALQERGLKPDTVHQVHRVLHAALRKAVRARKLAWNPMEGITPPKRGRSSEPRVFTLAEIRQLLRANQENQRWYPLWALLATTGMRLGEALGLQWGDLDLENGAVTIQRDVERRRGMGLTYGELKNASSYATLPLQPGAIAALRDLEGREGERHRLAGIEWTDTTPVFSSAEFTLVEPGTVNKAFRGALRNAGLGKEGSPHDLRHTVSSQLDVFGRTRRERQEALRHASPITTDRIYTHVVPDRLKGILAPTQTFFSSPEE